MVDQHMEIKSSDYYTFPLKEFFEHAKEFFGIKKPQDIGTKTWKQVVGSLVKHDLVKENEIIVSSVREVSIPIGGSESMRFIKSTVTRKKTPAEAFTWSFKTSIESREESSSEPLTYSAKSEGEEYIFYARPGRDTKFGKVVGILDEIQGGVETSSRSFSTVSSYLPPILKPLLGQEVLVLAPKVKVKAELRLRRSLGITFDCRYRTCESPKGKITCDVTHVSSVNCDDKKESGVRIRFIYGAPEGKIPCEFRYPIQDPTKYELLSRLRCEDPAEKDPLRWLKVVMEALIPVALATGVLLIIWLCKLAMGALGAAAITVKSMAQGIVMAAEAAKDSFKLGELGLGLSTVFEVTAAAVLVEALAESGHERARELKPMVAALQESSDCGKRFGSVDIVQAIHKSRYFKTESPQAIAEALVEAYGWSVQQAKKLAEALRDGGAASNPVVIVTAVHHALPETDEEQIARLLIDLGKKDCLGVAAGLRKVFGDRLTHHVLARSLFPHFRERAGEIALALYKYAAGQDPTRGELELVALALRDVYGWGEETHAVDLARALKKAKDDAPVVAEALLRTYKDLSEHDLAKALADAFFLAGQTAKALAQETPASDAEIGVLLVEAYHYEDKDAVDLARAFLTGVSEAIARIADAVRAGLENCGPGDLANLLNETHGSRLEVVALSSVLTLVYTSTRPPSLDAGGLVKALSYSRYSCPEAGAALGHCYPQLKSALFFLTLGEVYSGASAVDFAQAFWRATCYTPVEAYLAVTNDDRFSRQEVDAAVTTAFGNRDFSLHLRGGSMSMPGKEKYDFYSGPFTLAVQVQAQSGAKEPGGQILETFQDDKGYGLAVNSKGTLIAEFFGPRGGSVTYSSQRNTRILDGAVHLLEVSRLVTSKEWKVSLHLNGELVPKIPEKGSLVALVAADPFCVGAADDSDRDSFAGFIHSVKIYDCARPDGGFEDATETIEPVADWSFRWRQTHDFSKNRNDGTLQGTAEIIKTSEGR